MKIDIFCSNNKVFNFLAIIVLLMLLVLLSQPTVAKTTSTTATSTTNNTQQQKLYLSAEKYLWQPKSERFLTLYNQLNDYPLQPYLDQQILLQNIRLSNETAIGIFLDKYRGTPLDWPLRKKWLNYLAKKNKAELFVKYYKANNIAALNCMHLSYLIEEGIPASVALPQVTPLWVIGKSQSKKCDPLFEQWQEAGYQTDDVVWQRLGLAADGGKHTLIPYLTKLLPKDEKYLGPLWHKVRRDPAYVSRLDRFPLKSDKEAEIMLYGLQRLIWRNQKLALKTYVKAQQDFNFTPSQQEQINKKFAVALASKNHQDARIWLEKIDDSSLTKNMTQWRLAEIIEQQDWQRLLVEYNSLPEQFKRALKWQYWYARALIKTDKKQQGEHLLTQLAKERHYYGFLAASYLNLPVNLQHKPVTASQKDKQEILNNPAAKRAFELFYLNRFHQARREWNYWLQSLNDHQKLVASKVANEAQWFDRAIFTLSKVGYLDDVDLRFPLAYNDKIKHFSNKQKINPAWAFAIARRESSFMSDAHSSVGAKGLMQLMPRTAKQLQHKKVSNSYLLDPSNNIKLGTKYLKQLLDKYDGNAVLATASYNAGPYRVRSWVKKKPTLPADIWIETIPYKETRDYVKSVLAYQQIYQIQFGQENSVFKQVTHMVIGK